MTTPALDPQPLSSFAKLPALTTLFMAQAGACDPLLYDQHIHSETYTCEQIVEHVTTQEL